VETTGSISNYAPPASHNPQVVRVVLSDIQMSFGSMVMFILKWMFASIPAFIVMAVIMSIIFGILGVMFGGALAGLAAALGS